MLFLELPTKHFNMIKITLKNAFLLLFFSISTVLSYSQVIGYQCTFEDESEHCLWKLNEGNQGESCVNKWYIGKPGAKDGECGLFVSSDGLSNSYKNSGVSVVAYRTLHLQPGNYDIIIEWKGAGVNTDGLYVCWVPEKDTAKLKSVNNSFLQDFIVVEVVQLIHISSMVPFWTHMILDVNCRRNVLNVPLC